MNGIPWTNEWHGTPIGIPEMTFNSLSTCNIPKAAYIIGGTAAVVVAWPVVLGATGFTAGGIAGGSAAAGFQATVGNVAAGSLFSIAQSAAMGGSAAGVINGVVVGTGAVAAAFDYGKGKQCAECKDKNEGEKCHKKKESK